MCQQGLTFTVQVKSEQTVAVLEASVWFSSDPGTRLHGVAPGLQTDRDSSSHYKSGSDHPNMENK